MIHTVQSAALRASYTSALLPHSLLSFITPITHAAWKHVPTWYVKCMEDPVHSLAEQGDFIARLRRAGTLVDVKEMASDHCPCYSMPDELAEYVKSVVDGEMAPLSRR